MDIFNKEEKGDAGCSGSVANKAGQLVELTSDGCLSHLLQQTELWVDVPKAGVQAKSHTRPSNL